METVPADDAGQFSCTCMIASIIRIDAYRTQPPKHLTTMTENRFYALISRTTPTLVEFYATWCGPCRAMQTILEDLERNTRTRADVIRIDTDTAENINLTRQHRIMSVPTFILYREGRALWRHSGMISLDALTDVIRQYEKAEAL